jgi:hypothetical protein
MHQQMVASEATIIISLALLLLLMMLLLNGVTLGVTSLMTENSVLTKFRLHFGSVNDTGPVPIGTN